MLLNVIVWFPESVQMVPAFGNEHWSSEASEKNFVCVCYWLRCSLTRELIQFWTFQFFTWTTLFPVYHTLMNLGSECKCQYIASEQRRLKLTSLILFYIFTNSLLSFVCSVLPADGHPERPRTLDISPRPRPHPSHYLSPQAGSTGMPDLVSPPSKL